MNSSTIGNFPIPMFFLHFSFEPLAILVGGLEQEKPTLKNVFVLLLLLWTQATALLAQIPGPSTNAQLKRT